MKFSHQTELPKNMQFFPAIHNDPEYERWRARKLDSANRSVESRLIHIKSAASLRDSERKALISECLAHNFALYELEDTAQNNKPAIHAFASQLGLKNLDGNLCADQDQLTSITVTEHKGQHDYIPYTPKKLNWHTDGYYNPKARQINGMLLHCVNPANEGGETWLMDHELAYLLLRDENPEYINALFAEDVLTIPANIIDGEIIRAEQSGPVFSVDDQGRLHMRYSARLRNIEWKDDALVTDATAFLQKLWGAGSPLLVKHTLQAGQGVVCNNVLHGRTSFIDSKTPSRLLFRGRYYNYIAQAPNDKALESTDCFE